MKRLLFIFISFILYINCVAQEVSIQLYSDYSKDWHIEDRSLTITPTATYDRNAIYISSILLIEDMQVIVKDKHGYIVYSNIITIPSKQCYSFTFDCHDSEEYIIEIAYDNKWYYGYFSTSL